MKNQLLIVTLTSGALLAHQAFARPGGMPPPPDPETLAAEMFSDYDADENDALNVQELTTALNEIRAKHQAARQQDRPNRPGSRKRGAPPPAEEVAPDLIERFDISGDESLDTGELLKALEFMRDRRKKDGSRR